MKKNSTGLFLELSNKEIVHLTTIVNEILADGHNPVKKKLFTTADLWSIQRQKKSPRSGRNPL